MKFNKNKNSNKLILSYNIHKYMLPNLKLFANTTINILQDYFNPDSIMYLGNYVSSYKHTCTDIVDNLYKEKTRSPLRTTRKKQTIHILK
jgi:hypothetical protein